MEVRGACQLSRRAEVEASGSVLSKGMGEREGCFRLREALGVGVVVILIKLDGVEGV